MVTTGFIQVNNIVYISKSYKYMSFIPTKQTYMS